MRPISLTMINFMSHSKTEINFTDRNLVVVTGPNGAGKSSILQAITFALWGQVRTKSVDDVVKRGTGGCVVEFMFEINHATYVVTRRRRLTARGETDLEFGYFATSGPVPLTEPSIRETQAAIDKTLGLSYDVFANSAMLQQGESSRFSDARPGERKELLAEMLGLQELQAIEQSARAKLNTMKNSVRAKIAAQEIIARETEEAIAHSKNLDTTKAELQSAEKGRDQYRQLEKESETAFNNFIRDKTALEKAKYDLFQNEMLQNGLKEDIATRQEELDRAETVILATAVVEDNLAALTEAESRQAFLRMEQLRHARTAVLMAEIIAEETNLKDQVDELPDLLRRLHDAKQALDIYEKDVNTKQAEVALHRDERVQLQSDVDEIVTSKAEVQVIMAGWTTTAVEKSDAMDALQGQSQCPVCESELSEQRVSDLLSKYTEEKESADNKWARLNDELNALNESETAIRKRIRQLDDSIPIENKEIQAAWNKATVVETEIKGLEQTIADLEGKSQDLHEGRYALKQRKEMEEIGSVDFDQAELDALDVKVKSLSGARTQMRDIQLAEERVGILTVEIPNLEARLSELATSQDKLLKDIEEIKDRMVGPSENTLQQKMQLHSQQRKLLEVQVNDLVMKVAEEESAKKRAERLQNDFRVNEVVITDMQKKVDTAAIVVAATSKTGAQALIIESVLPQIEDSANDILSVLSPGTTLTLESQKLTKTGSARETLDIIIFNQGLSAPLESLSGGERFRADLALRLAIGQLLTRKSGTRVDSLYIDEGFGTQDADGIEGILSTISSLAALFSVILVITHVEAVSSSIASDGDILTVTKKGGASMVRNDDRAN